MRIGTNATLRNDPSVEIMDTGSGDLMLTIRDTASLDYVAFITSRERMVRILKSAAEQLQAYTPVDLGGVASRDDG